MNTIKVDKFIISTRETRGSGLNKLSPVRRLIEIFDFNGNLVAENDPHSVSIESLVDFIKYRFKGKDQNQVLEWAYQYFVEKES